MPRTEGPSGVFDRPPARERPESPGAEYGVPASGGEMVDWTFVLERLAAARNYWVATVRPDGRPHTAPIWGVLVDGDLFLETWGQSRKARNLVANPSVSVHLETGDEAVIVDGTMVPFRPDATSGRAIAAAFAAKYEGYRPSAQDWDDGGLYRVIPERVLAWRDMPTATRWRFAGGSRRPCLRSRRRP